MNIINSEKEKTEYQRFLDSYINRDRTIKIYETDNEEELFNKWKQEPLTYKSQKLVWSCYPETKLAEVIALIHAIDKRAEIKTIPDMYIMNAIPQNVYGKDYRDIDFIKCDQTEEEEREIYRYRIKKLERENATYKKENNELKIKVNELEYTLKRQEIKEIKNYYLENKDKTKTISYGELEDLFGREKADLIWENGGMPNENEL